MTDIYKSKDSPLKMLLTTPMNATNLASMATTSIPQINIVPSVFNVTSSITDISGDDASTKLITYFHQFSTTGEKELDPILMDHCYSRPWNWRPETSYIRPTKTLFVPKNNLRVNPTLPPQRCVEEQDDIDVESVSPPPAPIYEPEKAKSLMEECERHASLARVGDGNEDWEESVSKTNWTTSQNRLFSSMIKILNSDRMARLAYTGSWNEPILRRAVIDKSVQRVRGLMASISWDTRLTQWLHTLFIEHLSTSYLAAYLDILQTLKSKLPTFVEKMMFGSNNINRQGVTSNENLYPLLKRTWDPVWASVMQDKPKKLPGNPIIIVAASATSVTSTPSKRLHRWVNLLGTLANVLTVQANLGQTCLRMNMVNCADHLFNATRAKIQEVRNDCPGRPIILVGFNTGAAVACQVAEVEHVVAVVCMGFPLLTAEGRRGEPDDYLLDLQYPVLFVIGQNSHRTSREDMEDLRERMRVETGLIVVGSGDDNLRISKSKRRADGITQSIVDRCILDEIAEFLGSILLAPYPSVPRTQQTYVSDHFKSKQIKTRVRNNSNGSSIESEPPSPQPLKMRPVGRPPGTGKKKLQHSFQGFPNSPLSSGNPSMSPNNSNSSTSQIRPPSPDIVPNIPSDPNPGSYLSKPDVFRAANSAEALNRAIQTLPSVPTRSVSTCSTTLSGLLQGNAMRHSHPSTIRSTSGPGSTGLKILENIPVTSNTAQKILSSTGKPVTLINSTRASNMNNVLVLSDGTKCIRSTGSPKYVQTRRPMITKPRPPPAQIEPTLPPPNLTSAEIMDLPIIFADDNSLLAADPHPLDNQHQQQQTMPVKYAKIILSKRSGDETKTQQQIISSSQQRVKQQIGDTAVITTISPKKYDNSATSFEYLDLETELKATAVPKPMHSGMLNKSEIKQLLTGGKKSADGKMRNLTLRVPVTFNRSSNPAVPSRFVYTETGATSNDNLIVLNRTIAQNKHSILYEEDEDD
ncbi:Reduction in Cnn dots 1 [Carabus blaptoides fortunei]